LLETGDAVSLILDQYVERVALGPQRVQRVFALDECGVEPIELAP
jgi:multisubunit Na+/H+ antiporter MnhF subunit